MKGQVDGFSGGGVANGENVAREPRMHQGGGLDTRITFINPLICKLVYIIFKIVASIRFSY